MFFYFIYQFTLTLIITLHKCVKNMSDPPNGQGEKYQIRDSRSLGKTALFWLVVARCVF